MIKYTLRTAQDADEGKIKDLIHRMGINPFGLDWRHFIVAETAAGQFVGCGQLKPHRDGSMELASIAVEEPHRGQGVARMIIEQLLASSPRPLYLTCRANLRQLYGKFGFEVVGTERLPPFFRSIRLIFRLVKYLSRREQGLIMRLGPPA